MSRLLALALPLVTLASSALAQATFTREYSSFEGVAVNSGIAVELVRGNAHGISLEGPAAAIAELEIELDGDILKIGYRDDANLRFRGKYPRGVSGTVTLATLDRVIANGGAEVESAATWAVDGFKLLANGGAEVALNLEGRSAKVTANGGAEIELSGRLEQLEVMINGGAELTAGDLVTEEVKVSANGGSEVFVHATRSLKVNANGASEITYAGGIKNVDVNTNGASTVAPKG